MSKKKVLVTGGAGFLGINLIRYLYERGYDIVSYDFAEWTYPDLRNEITIIQADIRDVPALERAMQGVDQVVHCAAALPLYDPQDIYSTDIDGTRNVLDVAQKLGVERVVHISSTAVYGIPDRCLRTTCLMASARMVRQR